MSYLVVIFGQQLEWTVSTTVLVLMLVQLLIVAVALVVFFLLVLRKHVSSGGKQGILVAQAVSEKKERTLVGITLDTTAVKRRFKVGEEFEYDGLTVTANYDGEPATEQVTGYTVDAPATDREGKPSVAVRYGGFSAVYTVEIVAEEERYPVGMLLDTSAVRKEFRVGEPFECNGLSVRMNYNLEPFFEEIYTYNVEEPRMDEPGEKEVYVRYGGFVEMYSVTVLPAEGRQPIAIELDLDLVKTDFIIGEQFESEGLGVIARFETEPYEERVEDFVVETPDLSQKGMVNVVVRYGELVQTYPIFIAEERALVGITLDTSVVRREFATGEEFNCVGLIVTADYDAAPFSEQTEDFEVDAPDMTVAGEHEVTITYLGMSASYTVTVVEPVSAAPVASAPVAEEEANMLRYDRSFTARLIQSSDDTKHWYTLLKNELLSYRKVKDRMSWKRESYHLGRDGIAKFGFRGKMLCLFLALDPKDYADSKYKVEDVSGGKAFEGTPCMMRIKNERRVKRATELITVMMERLGAERYERNAEDYYLPYEGIYELVNKGLAKRLLVSGGFGSRPEAEGEVAIAAPLVIEEESVEGGTLRYDRSFRAKIIQSDEETQKYYSALKNELLSYKKVHERLSWKHETFKAGGTVAKLKFRGSTLCLFLPLDPSEYNGTRYKVEDASSNRSSEETPCLFRIKNEKRLRLAFDLIARVMEERGLPRIDRPEQDYTEPYQDIVKLIQQGLARREVKANDGNSPFGKKSEE